MDLIMNHHTQLKNGPGVRPCGRVENPKFPVPTVDGLSEPDWNDPRWANPDDIDAYLNAVQELKKAKARARKPAKPIKPSKPKKEKTAP